MPPLSWRAVVEDVKKVLSTGVNYFLPSERTVHAEQNALQKLPDRRDRGVRKVNLVVIKTSRTGLLGLSKPCLHCLMYLEKYAPMRGYKIEWVYYSDAAGMMIRLKFRHLVQSPDQHVSSYFRK